MRGTMKSGWAVLTAVCALVIGVYAYMVQPGALEMLTPDAADTYYNLLVQGFRAGQLSVNKEVPPGFAQLADPYDPVANLPYQSPPYRMLDLSYYKGRVFLYFGVTPALLLFWPYAVLTGRYLFHREAVTIFCAIGFLVSVGLSRALWRRYFAEASVWAVAACALALGLATGLPGLLSQPDVYEVAISCGYMLTMVALAGVWCALHETERKGRWLVMASVAYGLAVGARPSLLFGAVILLVPVVQAWRERLVASTRHERRRVGGLLAAAMGPIMLIGLGLMLYNARRFDSPFEFGQHYILAGEPPRRQYFSLGYLWFNLRVYFLGPARFSAHFPFVQGAAAPALPAGYSQFRNPFGILTNIPVVWLALAVPLAWRGQPGQAGSILRWFVMAVALVFVMSALTLGLFRGASFRYEVDFLPALVLLAVVGILGLERALVDWQTWRRAARWGWGLLLGFSVGFNVLASSEYYAEAHNNAGYTLMQAGKTTEALRHYQQAVRLKPDYVAAHNGLGVALAGAGRLEEAMGHWEQALRIDPDNAEAHYNLGIALQETGKTGEAIVHYQQSLRSHPDLARAHYHLGVALEQTGKPREAVEQYEEALRLEPDYVQARTALARLQAGK
jgi:tetratricopeptide (TPR) repeat protein